jgi:hypothetical protein
VAWSIKLITTPITHQRCINNSRSFLWFATALLLPLRWLTSRLCASPECYLAVLSVELQYGILPSNNGIHQ